MNLSSEQITNNGDIIIDFDQPLSRNGIIEIIDIALDSKTKLIYYQNKPVLSFNINSRRIYILFASITYLGGNGQHPIFKKRIQLKKWYKDFILDPKFCDYDIRIIGVYHYNGNVVFADFAVESYIHKKMNNSAAHIYINDLYKAIEMGFFSKTDRNNNRITVVSFSEFKNYLSGKISHVSVEEIDLIREFNEYIDKNWINAVEAITAMKNNDFSNWAQTEWQGWFLEYEFERFLEKRNIKSVSYLANSRKNENVFDLYFSMADFYSDLKTSNIKRNEAIGNDKERLIKSLDDHGKFWYIVYEHDTLLDKEINDNYSATRFMNHFKLENGRWPKNKPFDEKSYSGKMKHSIRFKNMFVLEINKSNYKHVLGEFNQGHQPSGAARKPKFTINKRNIDNFLIYEENL